MLLAYKMDFDEELDRLGSHVTEMLQILDAQGARRAAASTS